MPGPAGGIGGATVERCFQDYLGRAGAQRKAAACPRVLDSDEHFFSRKDGYGTTFCDLRRRTIFDVVLGRSEAALEDYLAKLPGKDRVRVVCMGLAIVYRAIVRKHFPKAKIVADRFHGIRLINHHFLACWREIDPAGSKHRGLLSLTRRHRHNLNPHQVTRLEVYFGQSPVLREIYGFKQRLCYLLLKSTAPENSVLTSWAVEIATMWRFTRNNGITQGFRTKMEVLKRQAFGFRNFNNYPLRVRIMRS